MLREKSFILRKYKNNISTRFDALGHLAPRRGGRVDGRAKTPTGAGGQPYLPTLRSAHPDPTASTVCVS